MTEENIKLAPRYRHKKRGTTYEMIGTDSLQANADISEGCNLCIYRDEVDGKLWARPVGEFLDGRFSPLAVEEPPNG